MSKDKFLDKLTEALLEYLTEAEAYDHIRYYSDYIDEKKKLGIPESEVIDGIGNPRLIAKSIVDGIDQGRNIYNFKYEEEPENKKDIKDKKINVSYNGKSIDPFMFKLVGIIVAILVVIAVVGIIYIMSVVFFKFILPIIIILLIFSMVRGVIKRS